MSDAEIFLVFNKNKNIGRYICTDLRKNIDVLRKYNYTQEQIIKMLMFKQHLFNYTVVDLTTLIDEITENEKCSVKDVIDYYL